MARNRWIRGTDPSGYGEGFFLRLDTAPTLVCDAYGYVCRVLGRVDVVEVRLWEEMDSSAVPLYGKYNVMAGSVDFEYHLEVHDVSCSVLKSNGLLFVDEPYPTARWNHFGAVITQGDVLFNHDDTVAAVWGSSAWWQSMAESCWSYGSRDLDSDNSGNNIRALLAGVGVSLRGRL